MDVQLRIYDSADESGQLLVVFDRNDEEEQEADLVVNEIETIEVVTHILPDPVTQADVQVWDRTAFLANTHAYDIYIYIGGLPQPKCRLYLSRILSPTYLSLRCMYVLTLC